MEVPWQFQFRIIALGDSTVGKSSLLRRYTEDQFTTTSDPTVGVDFYTRTVTMDAERGGPVIKLQLWDTAGQEKFRCITKSYYRNSVGGLLVFDLTNRTSFEHIKGWYTEVVEHVIPNKIIFLLIGHKNDRVEDRKVSRDEAEKLAHSLGCKYMETSAKTNSNVERAFELLTRSIYESLKMGDIVLRSDWDGVKAGYNTRALEPEETETEVKKCQC